MTTGSYLQRTIEVLRPRGTRLGKSQDVTADSESRTRWLQEALTDCLELRNHFLRVILQLLRQLRDELRLREDSAEAACRACGVENLRADGAQHSVTVTLEFGQRLEGLRDGDSQSACGLRHTCETSQKIGTHRSLSNLLPYRRSLSHATALSYCDVCTRIATRIVSMNLPLEPRPMSYETVSLSSRLTTSSCESSSPVCLVTGREKKAER